jgi:hypothetical protein
MSRPTNSNRKDAEAQKDLSAGIDFLNRASSFINSRLSPVCAMMTV